CSLEMYRRQHGVAGYHANCHDSLCRAMHDLGLDSGPLPPALNLFMAVEISPEGKLSFLPPRSKAGDSIVVRAEMDLAIALSACPASTCNGGAPTRQTAH